MKIHLHKQEIIGRMGAPVYGQQWLVVSASGNVRTAWTQGIDVTPAVDPDEYFAFIPTGLYNDDQELLARGIVDETPETQWRYVQDVMASDDPGEFVTPAGEIVNPPDVVRYAQMMYPERWNLQVVTAVDLVADSWLELLNQVPAEIAPWGFDSNGNGEYTAVRPPFRLAWAPIED